MKSNWYTIVRNNSYIEINRNKRLLQLNDLPTDQQIEILFKNYNNIKQTDDFGILVEEYPNKLELNIGSNTKIIINNNIIYTIQDIIEIYDKDGNNIYTYDQNNAIIYKPNNFNEFKSQLQYALLSDKININWIDNIKPNIDKNTKYKISIGYGSYDVDKKFIKFYSINDNLTFKKYNSDLDDVFRIKININDTIYQFYNFEDNLIFNWNKYLLDINQNSWLRLKKFKSDTNFINTFWLPLKKKIYNIYNSGDNSKGVLSTGNFINKNKFEPINMETLNFNIENINIGYDHIIINNGNDYFTVGDNNNNILLTNDDSNIICKEGICKKNVEKISIPYTPVYIKNRFFRINNLKKNNNIVFLKFNKKIIFSLSSTKMIIIIILIFYLLLKI